MSNSSYSGAPAVRFHTRPLSRAEADRLHETLGGLVPALDAWLGGDDGAAWVGAVAPADSSPAGLERLAARLRAEPFIEPLTIAVGRFP